MSEFLRVTKNGEVIEISPLVLKEHEALGWTLVNEAASKAAEKAEQERLEGKKAVDDAVAKAEAKAKEDQARADAAAKKAEEKTAESKSEEHAAKKSGK